MPEKTSRKTELIGFKYSFNGLHIAFRQEFNFRFDIAFGAATLLLGWFFGLSPVEWLIIIGMIGFVLTAEIFNTALEELCDKFQPEHDPHIGKIKDLSAAAVLISSITALTVGGIIFLPLILEFLR